MSTLPEFDPRTVPARSESLYRPSHTSYVWAAAVLRITFTTSARAGELNISRSSLHNWMRNMTKTHNLPMRYEKRCTFTEYFLCIFFAGGGDIRMRGARNSVASIQGHGNLLHAGDSTSDVSPAFYYPLTSQSRVPQMRYKMSPAPYRVMLLLLLLSPGLRWVTLSANGYGLIISRHLLSLSEWTRKRRTHVGVFWHKKQYRIIVNLHVLQTTVALLVSLRRSKHSGTFEVLIATIMNNIIFRHVTSCNLAQIYRRFGSKFLPDYTESHTETPSEPQNSHSLTAVSVAHTISISRAKKTVNIYQTTRHHMPGSSNLNPSLWASNIPHYLTDDSGKYLRLNYSEWTR